MVKNAPLFLALRYLRPKRSFVSVITLISIIGVMLGVGVLVVVMSVFKGWQIEFKKLLLGFEPHVLLIQDPPFAGEVDPNAPPPFRSNWREVLAAVQKRPGLVSAVPVASGYAVLEGKGDPQGLELFGLKTEGGNALVDKLRKHIKEGEFDLDSDNIILNDRLAEELGIHVGDTLVVHSADTVRQLIQEVREIERESDENKRADAYGQVTVWSQDLKLVATLRADTAGARGYVPLHTAQELFQLEDDVTAIEIELPDPENARQVANELYESGILPVDWAIRTWSDEHGMMLASVENQQSLLYFILLIIMLVASICVMNTTITVTVQKRREIGILTALGTRARQILSIFLAQAAVVALGGVALGLAGGFTFLHFRNDIRALLSRWTGRDFFPSDIYFLSSIPSHPQAGDLFSVCGAAVVLCLMAAFIPAYFAARVDPAVALRD